jgi:tape measure domain-containing protein
MANIDVNVKLESTKAQSDAEKLARNFNKTQEAVDKTNRQLRLTSKLMKSFEYNLKFLGRSFYDNLTQPISNFVAKITSLVNVIDLTNVFSEFLGVRNALALASTETDNLSEKLEIGNRNLSFAAQLATKYKVNLISLTKEYSKFTNAAVLAGKTINESNKYFTTFSKLARILNMDGQAISGMFLALEQMISKGFVSMEELRRQLGQYIPGAMELAAKAMGYGSDQLKEFYDLVASGKLTTKEFLDPFVAQIEKFATDALLEEALKKPQAALQGLINTFTKLQVVLGSLLAPHITSLLEKITSLIDKFISWIEPSNAVAKALFNTAEQTENVYNAVEPTISSINNFTESAVELKKEITSAIEPLANVANSFNDTAVAMVGITAASGPLLVIGQKLKALFVALFVKPLKSLIGFIARFGYLIALFVRLHPAATVAATAVTGLVYALSSGSDEAEKYANSLKLTNEELAALSEQSAKAAEITRKASDVILQQPEILFPKTLEEMSLRIGQLTDKIKELEEKKAVFESFGDTESVAEMNKELRFMQQRLEGVLITAARLYQEFSGKKLPTAEFKDLTDSLTKMSEDYARQLAITNYLLERKIKLNSEEAKVVTFIIKSQGDLNSEQAKRAILLAKENDKLKANLKLKKEESKVLKNTEKNLANLIAKYTAETKALKGNETALKRYNIELEYNQALEQAQKYVLEDNTRSLEERQKQYEKLVEVLGQWREAKIQAISEEEKYTEVIKETNTVVNTVLKETADAFDDFGEGLADAVVQGLTGGIESFNEFSDIIRSLMLQLLRDLMKLAIMNPIQFTGMFSASGMVGGASSLIGGAGGSGGFSFGSAALDIGKGLLFGGSSILTGLGTTIGAIGGTGSFLGAVGGGLQMVGATGFSGLGTALSSAFQIGGTTGLGIGIGATLPYLLPALALAFAFGAFDDKEAASRFWIDTAAPTKNMTTTTSWGKAFYDKEGLISAAYETPFGWLSAGGQHFGKDEQLSDADRAKYVEGMMELFGQMAALDQAIINSYDLSAETVQSITDQIAQMERETKKWKTPDIGNFLIDRYKIIFEEVDKTLYDALDLITFDKMDDESAIEAINIVISLGNALSTLKDVAGTTTEVIDAQSMTLSESFYSQQEALTELISSFDGSYQATEELTAGLAQFANTSVQLVAMIRAEAEKASFMFAGTKERILLDTLDDAGKYKYYQEQYDTAFDQIATASSPEELARISDILNAAAMAMWDIQKSQEISPEALTDKSQEWFAALDEADSLIADKFSEFEDKAIEEASKTAEAAADMLSAAAAMKEASEDIGDAADTINDAASKLLEWLSTIDINVTVNQQPTSIGEIG